MQRYKSRNSEKRTWSRNSYSNNRRGQNRRFQNTGKNDAATLRGIRDLIASVRVNTSVQEDYKVQHTFDDFAISQRLKDNIYYKRYKEPTPIQDQAIPQILKAHDIIGIANTGTGKTAAFLIPLIQKVIDSTKERILILVPTHELADQISDELYSFNYETGVTWSVCVGGANMKGQWEELERDPHFVIGTPGRIKDFVQKGVIKLERFTTVVLDEADRMVDIGFIHEIKFFISRLSPNRQSLFFSATITPKVNEILKSFVKDPVLVSVKTSDSLENIEQHLIEVSDKFEKIEKLHDLLISEGFDKVIIFGRTKWGVQRLSNELVDRGFRAEAIHGNKTQNQRTRTLNDFKSERIHILLATDVASRGIDIDDISHVINYDLPGSVEDYIHRIGRTGRAQKKGKAITFVDRY